MDITKSVAALFDFDGVVMDTETQYSLFWKKQGEKYHPEIPDFNLIIKGQTLTQIFGKYFTELPVIQNKIRKELTLFEERMRYDYIAGVFDFLKSLHEQKIKTALVTSSDMSKMKRVFTRYPMLEKQFDVILTAERFKRSKPDPECYLSAARELNISPLQCYVFEDSFHGLEAGRRANMTVIGVATTYSRKTILDKADEVIADFKDFTLHRMMEIKIKPIFDANFKK